MSDDPMADFLAREKAALGDDAELFSGGGAPSAPSGMDFGDFALQQPPAKAPSPQPSGIDAFPSLDSPGPGSQVRVTGAAGTGEDEDVAQFESAFPDLSGEVGYEQAPKPVYNALAPQPYGTSPYPATNASQSAGQPPRASSILPAPQFTNTLPSTEEDTEPIKAWKAKQAEEIKKRDERDRERREEMKGKAERDIDAFYERYNKEKEKTIRENKENEAAFVEKIQEGTAKGTAWERITDLIALENSQSKTIRPSVPGGSDLARMKEILLALRREGDKAPGAAGF